MIDLDRLIRDADPAQGVDFPPADPDRVRRGADGFPRPRRPSWDVVVVAAAVAVVVGVAAVALSAGGDRQPSPTGGGPVTEQRGAAPLLRILGVLRRPATAADRAAWVTVGGKAVVPGSERLAASAPWRAEVIMFVHRARPADRLNVFVATRSRTKSGSALQTMGGGTGWTAREIQAGQAVLQQPRSLTVGQPPGRGGQSKATLPVRLFMVVPDGVARVSFLKGADTGSSSWISEPVRSNVAFAQLTSYCCGPSAVARWYAANGKLVKVVGGPPGPRTLSVLRTDGIGGVRFGSSPTVVRARLSVMTGQAGGPYAPGGSCGLDHRIKWWDQWTANGEPALTAYFRRGAFVGYQVGDLSAPRRQNAGWEFATTRGLRVGDTLAQARRLYGSAVVVSPAQGGSWSLHDSGGFIRGYAWAWQGPGVRQGLVATIDAGDVGCPASSP